METAVSLLTYSTLLPQILPETPGCSDPLAVQAVRDTVIELCRSTRLWRHRADLASVRAGVADYDLDDVPQQAAVVTLLSIVIDGAMLYPASEDQLDVSMPSWRTDTGTPVHYLQLDPSAVTLVPCPDTTVAKSMSMTLAVMPSRTSTGFPGWINDQHQDCIVVGAKARLLAMQAHPWYSPNMAVAYAAQFRLLSGAAIDAGTRSLVRARLRTTPQH